jgi:cytochrome bd-type quinol oxidase subunit 2
LLGILGVSSAAAGIGFAFYMVGSSSGEHFRVLHTYFGAFTALFLIATPALGQAQFKVKTKKKLVRNFHRWFGRIALVLMLLTIFVGLIQAGIL